MVNSSVTIYTRPCLSDNYAYVVFNSANGTAAIVDVPEAGPLVDKISELNVPVTDIFLTHHHSDHVDGLADLQGALTDSLSQAPAQVIGARADAHRLPALDRSVGPGDCLTLCGIACLRVRRRKCGTACSSSVCCHKTHGFTLGMNTQHPIWPLRNH